MQSGRRENLLTKWIYFLLKKGPPNPRRRHGPNKPPAAPTSYCSPAHARQSPGGGQTTYSLHSGGVSDTDSAGSSPFSRRCLFLACRGRHAPGGTNFCAHTRDRNPLGCGALFLLHPSQRACKKQTAAPAPLRLLLPQAAPQLRSPWYPPFGQNLAQNRALALTGSHTLCAKFPCMCPSRTRVSSGWDVFCIHCRNCPPPVDNCAPLWYHSGRKTEYGKGSL